MNRENMDFESVVETLESQIQAVGYSETEIIDPTEPGPEVTSKSEEADDATDTTKAERQSEAERSPEKRVILVNAEVGPDFVVLANENDAFFQIQSSYTLWREIATRISVGEAQEIVPQALIEEIPEDHSARAAVHPKLLEDEDIRVQILAAFELLDNLDTELHKRVVYRLTEIFTEAEIKHVIDSTNETGGASGFTVFYKIFPYEDDFGLRELNNVIEQVRMASHHGTQFLRNTFNLGVDISKATAGDVTRPQTPDEQESLQEMDLGLTDSLEDT